MKKILGFLFAMSFLANVLFSQIIYNSNDVKIKTPLKQNWEYKYNGNFLNEKIVENNIYINSINGVSAVSFTDGKEIWKYDFPKSKGIHSVVNFNDKYAVFTSYKYDASTEKGTSYLTVLNLADGKEKWSLQSNEIFYNAPAEIFDENIYCITGPPKKWYNYEKYWKMELDEANLESFSITDGKTKWKSALNDNESYFINVDKDYIFLAFGIDNDPPKNKLLAVSSKDGKELWDYKPSGMLKKIKIGDAKIYNGNLYTFSIFGIGGGQIACLDLTSGEEKWNQSVYNLRDKFFYKDEIYCSGILWVGNNIKTGEKLFEKKLIKQSILSQIGSALLGGFFGGFISLGDVIFGGKAEDFKYTFIPTNYLINDLAKIDLANDKNLLGMQKEKDEVIFKIYNKKKDDDNLIETKFGKENQDLFIANGCNLTNAFLTSKGKVYSINLQSGKIDWEKDFSGNEKVYSYGLVINGDNMFLFTSTKLIQLSNE